jgi:hypothetical protein
MDDALGVALWIILFVVIIASVTMAIDSCDTEEHVQIKLHRCILNAPDSCENTSVRAANPFTWAECKCKIENGLLQYSVEQ